MLKEELHDILGSLNLPKGFEFYEVEGRKIFEIVTENSFGSFRYVDLDSGELGLTSELICYLMNKNWPAEFRSKNGGVVNSKKVLIYPIAFNSYLNYSPENVKDLVLQAVKQLERPDKTTG